MKQFLLCFLALPILAHAQKIEILTSGRATSIRGMSVVDDKIAWVSGSNGQVGKSVDGGNTWTWYTVRGFEKSDFRDIEAFDEKTAVIMGVAEPAYILKTFNGGETWKLVYSDSTRGVFLDAMEFWEDGRGMVIGDPTDGKMYMARCIDFGNQWQRTESAKLPALEKGEAFFASSGTNVRAMNFNEACVVTGGKKSRIYIRGRLTDLPLMQGGESLGANSVAVWSKGKKTEKIVVVGGDFARDTLRTANCVYSTDQGRSWQMPAEPPHGYRSCVEFLDKSTLVACGTSGVDISNDAGKHWNIVSTDGFHVVRKARYGSMVLLAGSRGRIARLQ
jgi:photosystem II stability/assembly factor-like uncharacterized protein